MTKTDRNALSALVITVVVIFALKILHAQLVYGDWACAFAECRKVVSS